MLCFSTSESCVLDAVIRNPIGRTGIRGRGCLGRWGPNHAADPIVTRYFALHYCMLYWQVVSKQLTLTNRKLAQSWGS